MIIDFFIFMFWFYLLGALILFGFWVLFMLLEFVLDVWDFMVTTHKSRGKY
jgi:hypothetical protein